jgi:hypothetical protein
MPDVEAALQKAENLGETHIMGPGKIIEGVLIRPVHRPGRAM